MPFDQMERNVDVLLRCLCLCMRQEEGYCSDTYHSLEKKFKHRRRQNLYAAASPKMLDVDVYELDGRALQMAVLQREKKIGARTIDDV